MADYILFMLADEQTYRDFRKGFASSIETLDRDFLQQHLWLHSNNYMCNFPVEWGRTIGSPVVVDAALQEWLLSDDGKG